MAISASDFHADNRTHPTDLATEIDGLMGHGSKYELITPLIPLPTPKKTPTRHGQMRGYGRKFLDPPETPATVVGLFSSPRESS